MAKKDAAAKQDAGAEVAAAEGEGKGKGQGRAVNLPNGARRIDFIRDRFYKDGVKRGDIRKEINEMLEAAGRKDEQIPYQIVFAATKTETDPRLAKPAGEGEAAAE